jgi:hypothetical protein
VPWILEHFWKFKPLYQRFFDFGNSVSQVILENIAKKRCFKSDKKGQKTGRWTFAITSPERFAQKSIAANSFLIFNIILI